MSRSSSVLVTTGTLTLPTYLPERPNRNPMFLEKRVYQGSSGKVYPLPLTDRIAEKPVERAWTALWIENEFLRVLVLPEIGGRIHAIEDKTTGYDLIYRQEVIRPALVGLAGPWISGGIEFNWPQHHRPTTFMPVDTKIEEHADGSKTIWCGEHDPMSRMKGMHGICLHPGRSYLEIKARAYNRTTRTQTFLWWANIATEVHEAYQSFFPPDVHYVADHARRSMSEYPQAQGFYYGVDYGERGRTGVPEGEQPALYRPPRVGGKRSSVSAPAYAPNDLSFYANIPVPTSYMAMGSRDDFFGGYDHAAQAGLVHIADHHISPGKKQWTWGNHEFGYAWDRNLTDPATKKSPPYIELMAGVYTDNQPDFSFLQPGETKTWSQYLYPIRRIGPARQANRRAAVGLRIDDGRIFLGVDVTEVFPRARVVLRGKEKILGDWKTPLSPTAPFVRELKAPKGLAEVGLAVEVLDGEGKLVLSYQGRSAAKAEVPPAATEPPPPAEIASTDELFLTGLHLEQYRHATRGPTDYWLEALRRDPLDARCNNAMGRWHLQRGELADAEAAFRRAIERMTRRNPNPPDGEPFYNLGLCLRHQGRDDEAYDAFYKSVWNQAWMAAGYHALAEIDATRGDWPRALEHLDVALRYNTDNLRARDLRVLVLRRLGRNKEAQETLAATLALDPLDWWARLLSGEKIACDAQAALDLAHDFARAGFHAEAIELLQNQLEKSKPGSAELPDQNWGAASLVQYTLGWLHRQQDDAPASRAAFAKAAALAPDYCFPSRLEEIEILQAAIEANPKDARALYLLGNLLYDRRRHRDAIECWERSAKIAPKFSIVWRNLGIGYFNVALDSRKARAAYDRAFRAAPDDARVFYERDQLWKRLGEKPETRLKEMRRHFDLVAERDDLAVEFCALLNQTGHHAEAERVLAARRFQPWEGGEGGALGQHVRAQTALGFQALARGDGAAAVKRFEQALTAPANLGEAFHLLANRSAIHYGAGLAWEKCGDSANARRHWLAAARFRGDFQAMSVRAFSEMTYYSALAWRRLGNEKKARGLLRQLLTYAQELQRKPAKIDYFATSLPTLLLFDDDLQFRQETDALFLQAQARLGLGERARARTLLCTVLRRDPGHALAADLLAEIAARKSTP